MSVVIQRVEIVVGGDADPSRVGRAILDALRQRESMSVMSRARRRMATWFRWAARNIEP